MAFQFIKYSAAGNDFILIDIREKELPSFDVDTWTELCSRRTGVGADGVLLVGNSSNADVKMAYINADGREVEMCGNGLRALSHYVFSKNSSLDEITVQTMNGLYSAKKEGEVISVSLPFIEDIDKHNLSSIGSSLGAISSFYVKVAVPHSVFEVQNIAQVDLDTIAPAIRDNRMFENGTNVNIYSELGPNHVALRTFERGVGETLACGTGAVATALAYIHKRQVSFGKVTVMAKGGELTVTSDKNQYSLSGPAYPVYEGTLLADFSIK